MSRALVSFVFPLLLAAGGTAQVPTPPGPAVPPAPVAAADELPRALSVLEGYTPQKAAPTDAVVLAATETLRKAVGKLARTPADPTSQRLQALLAARRPALTPSKANPIRDADPLARVLVRFWNEQLLTTPAREVHAEPAAVAFPGQPPTSPAVTRTVAIDLAVPGRHSLGLYAVPGVLVTVTCTAPPRENDLHVRIGAHSDDLQKRPAWPRFPKISRTFPLGAGETAAANPFGGLVYLEVGKPGPAGAKLEVTVSGAIDAPLFVLGTTDLATWRETGRNAPGPWAELATGKVVLTVPSSRVRELADPTDVLRFWDRVLDGAADLVGRAHERARPERYVADLEISAGYMHSGYPIMTHLDAAADMVDLARMQKGPWGLFHELGHNHQNRDWTFGGTTEVTVNLFSLYLCETLCGVGQDRAWSGNLGRAAEALTKKLAAGEAPWGGDEGKPDLALRLLMYAQLQREFGWATFTKVFREYAALPEAERPKDDAARHDQWLLRFSRATGRNLGPFFVKWGLSTSEAARAAVAELPEWLPKEMVAGK